jgi:hypothetical protein
LRMTARPMTLFLVSGDQIFCLSIVPGAPLFPSHVVAQAMHVTPG